MRVVTSLAHGRHPGADCERRGPRLCLGEFLGGLPDQEVRAEQPEHREDENPDGRAGCVDRVPDEQDDQEPKCDPVGCDGLLAQERGDRLTCDERRPGRPGEPCGGDEQDPHEHDPAGHVVQNRRGDPVDVVDRHLQRGIMCERAGDRSLEDRAAEDDQHAGDDSGQADRHQRPPAMPLREKQREYVQKRHQDRQPERQALDHLAAVLDVLELVGLEDRELRDGWREVRSEVRRKPEAGRNVVEDPAQIERHRTLIDPDRALAAVDDVDERLVGGAVGLRPQGLDPRPGQRKLRALDGGIAQRPRGGCRQALELRRQALLDQAGDVDVRVQLIDYVVGRRGSDILVLEQLGARVRPVVGAEQEPVGPRGEDSDDKQQRRHADQHVDADQPPARDLRGRGVHRRSRGRRLYRALSLGRRSVDLRLPLVDISLISSHRTPQSLVSSARHHRPRAARMTHRLIWVMPATLARSNIVSTRCPKTREEPPDSAPWGRSWASAPERRRRRCGRSSA